MELSEPYAACDRIHGHPSVDQQRCADLDQHTDTHEHAGVQPATSSRVIASK